MTYLQAMTNVRLDNEERRNAIVAAAVPIFARKGFAGTTTKQIAEGARVSEALVFKHFPSKAALYEEIMREGCRADPAMAKLQSLQPSTTTLIESVEYLVRHLTLSAAFSSEESDRLRLIVTSLLDDGEYARLAFRWLEENVFPQIEACLQAAQRAGDLVDIPITFVNRFWFSHHLAIMLGCIRLPDRDIQPSREDAETRVSEIVWFILRGLGVKDGVIASHRVPTIPAATAAE